MLYTLDVNSRKMIDLQRIIDENQDKEVLLVTIEGCEYKLLLVSLPFLACFCTADCFDLGGQKLGPGWGHDTAGTTFSDFGPSSPGNQDLTWRARSITDVRQVVLELRAARAALITVKVHSL